MLYTRLIYSTLNIFGCSTLRSIVILIKCFAIQGCTSYLLYTLRFGCCTLRSSSVVCLIKCFFFIETSSTPYLLNSFLAIAAPDHLQLSSLFDIQTSCYYTQDVLTVAPFDHLQLSDWFNVLLFKQSCKSCLLYTQLCGCYTYQHYLSVCLIKYLDLQRSMHTLVIIQTRFCYNTPTPTNCLPLYLFAIWKSMHMLLIMHTTFCLFHAPSSINFIPY